MKIRLMAGVAALTMAALALPAVAAQAKGESHSVLPFIEDDYTKALATAKASNVPIFVDVWAPW